MANYNALILDFGEQPPSTIFLTLPKFKTSGGGGLFSYGDASFNLSQIKIVVDARGITATFPSLILTTGFYTDPAKTVLARFNISATGETLLSDISATLPRFQIAGSLLTGEVGSINSSLPSLTVSSRGHDTGDINVTLPLFSVSGTAPASSVGSALLRLPFISVSGNGIIGEVADGSINFHNLEINASGLTGIIADGYLQFIPLILSSNGLTGRTGYSDIRLSRLLVLIDGYSYQNVDGNINILLPHFYASGTGYIIPVELWETYVMNTKNYAISRYTYNFNSYTKFNNSYLGANSNGIFSLTGDKDNEAPIISVITTGMIGGNSDALKRMIDIIISLKGNGSYQLVIQSDDGMKYTYPINKSDSLLQAIKTKLGRGLKGKYWICEFSNTNGANFEVDTINTDMEVLQKRYTL